MRRVRTCQETRAIIQAYRRNNSLPPYPVLCIHFISHKVVQSRNHRSRKGVIELVNLGNLGLVADQGRQSCWLPEKKNSGSIRIELSTMSCITRHRLARRAGVVRLRSSSLQEKHRRDTDSTCDNSQRDAHPSRGIDRVVAVVAVVDGPSRRSTGASIRQGAASAECIGGRGAKGVGLDEGVAREGREATARRRGTWQRLEGDGRPITGARAAESWEGGESAGRTVSITAGKCCTATDTSGRAVGEDSAGNLRCLRVCQGYRGGLAWKRL